MKKLVIAAICCFSLCVGSVMGQDQDGRQNRQVRGMRGGMRNAPVQLADTSITNHLEITPEQIQKVEELNQNFAESMKVKMTSFSQMNKNTSREEREARMAEVRALRQEANKQLREVLGTEAYIQYLETALERASAMRSMRGPGSNNHGQRPMMRGGFGGGPEGFGGPGFEN